MVRVKYQQSLQQRHLKAKTKAKTKAKAKAKTKAKTPELPPAIPAGMMCCYSTAKPVTAHFVNATSKFNAHHLLSKLMVEMMLRSRAAPLGHLALAFRASGFLGGERRWHWCCRLGQGAVRDGLRSWGVAFRSATRGNAERAKHSVSWLRCRRLLGAVRASLVRLDAFCTARTLLQRASTWCSFAFGLDSLLRLLFLSWLCLVPRRFDRRHDLLLMLVVL